MGPQPMYTATTLKPLHESMAQYQGLNGTNVEALDKSLNILEIVVLVPRLQFSDYNVIPSFLIIAMHIN